MNIGIVGTRDPSPSQIERIKQIIKNHPDSCILSGGARGSDFEAMYWKLFQHNEDIRRFYMMKHCIPITHINQINLLQREILKNNLLYRVCNYDDYYMILVGTERVKWFLNIITPNFDNGYSVQKYHIRNDKIVLNSDIVYIFMKKNGKNLGSNSVRKFCNDYNKKYKIIWDDQVEGKDMERI